MKAGYTLAWSEGTYLTQQHFQCWGKTIDQIYLSVINHLVPYAYGVMQCEFDDDAIRQGICRLTSLQLLTRSGHHIVYQSTHMPVVECLLNDSSALIYLHWSQNDLCRGLSGYDNMGPAPQFEVEYHLIRDMHDTQRAQEVAFKRYRIELSNSPMAAEGTYSMPIARVRHNVGNQYEFDKAYMPTAMSFKAVPSFNLFLERLIPVITHKLSSLKQQLSRKWDAGSHIEANVWSQCLISLMQIKSHQIAHPYDVYLVLIIAIQQLFIAKTEDCNLPTYCHEALTETFSGIENILNTLCLIDAVPEEDKIFLTKIDEHHLTTGHIPGDVIHAYEWYLGVNMHADDVKWVQQFVQQVKLGTAETLPSILMSALPGISLQHVQRPPSSIVLKSGYEYFRMKKGDAYWQSMVSHQNMKIYLPRPFHMASLTLDIIKE